MQKPTKFNPPYPVGNPQGLHPVPQNTGSSSFGSTPIGISKYPQASSQPSSSSFNPHYPNTGNQNGVYLFYRSTKFFIYKLPIFLI